MMRRVLLGATIFFMLAGSNAAQATDKPNILLIMSDDVGITNVKCLWRRACRLQYAKH
jgi:hypothetical protein